MAKAAKGKVIREQEGWVERQNRALRDRGYQVSLDLHQGMVRLRATLPPKPSEPLISPWKQRRISTGLRYPDQASDVVKKAELLGACIEKAKRTKEPFDWRPWDSSQPGYRHHLDPARPLFTGIDALRQTEICWYQKRKRSVSADTTWAVDYAAPLKPLLLIPDLQPEHLINLVEATAPSTRTRRRCSQAAATLAKAIGFSAEVQQELRTMGRGYSPTTDTAPRNVPTDEALVAFIDSLPTDWQWPVGICAVYGARPHEALLYSEVLSSKLLAISDGKTGSRTCFPLPSQWIDRWDLTTKRLPVFDYDRSNKVVGAEMGIYFRKAQAGFKPYDVRHAFALRTIYSPKINPSLAAKSMGHSLQVHNRDYQKWFDASGMEALHAQLLSEAA